MMIRRVGTAGFTVKPGVFLLLLLVLFGVGPVVWAKPVGRDAARVATRSWLGHSPTPMGVSLASAINKVTPYHDDDGTTLCHVVSLSPGGYVIMAGDDGIEPVIAFSPKGSFTPGGKDPLSKLVRNDLRARLRLQDVDATATARAQRARAQWVKLTAAATTGSLARAAAAENGVSFISDVRVPALVQSQWAQDTITNASGSAVACYNYYTPPGSAGSTSNYPDGCVATATAQLLRYYQYPTAAVGTAAYTIYVESSSSKSGYVAKTVKLRGGDGNGGAYDWANMPLIPEGSATTVQCQAIGALCYDAGISAKMYYASSSSGAYLDDQCSSLLNAFQCANAIYGSAVWSSRTGSYTTSVPANFSLMTLPNLDAGHPVILGIYDMINGGHDILCDGYGYVSSTLYYHLNMGWSGQDDEWYNLPPINAGGYNFSVIGDCVFNIYPAAKGEIISGRIVDASGTPLSGVTVTATTSGGAVYTAVTNDKGIYALANIPSATSYTILPSAAGYTFTAQTASTGTSSSATWSSDYTSVTVGGVGNVWGKNFTGTAVGILGVAPQSVSTASGTVGKYDPAPASLTFTLTNTMAAPLAWTAASDQNWVNLNLVGGSGLIASSSAVVTATFNTNVLTLGAGTHTATLTFTNSNQPSQVLTRQLQLTLSPANAAAPVWADYR